MSPSLPFFPAGRETPLEAASEAQTLRNCALHPFEIVNSCPSSVKLLGQRN